MDNKKILMIIAPRDFRDEEYLRPRKVFEKYGYEVVVASSSLAESSGMLGLKAKPDIALKDVRAADYKAVVFVGGKGAQVFWEDKMAHRLAQDFFGRDKIVAAICIAPVILANAGILEGSKATCFMTERPRLAEKGAIVSEEPVVRDGDIVTASGPEAADLFAVQIVDALSEKEQI